MYNEELKREMKEEMIKKSSYEYLFNEKQHHKEFRFPTNIFRRKEEKSKEIDMKTVDKLISQIEEKWVTEQ